MYEAFYGFKEKPFSMLPDPSFLFLSKKHRAALTLLEYGLMNQVGFCILSGEPGAGKTTILRALLKRVDDNVKVGLISNTHQSFGGLLDWILSAFDLHKADLTQVEMHQLFVDFLIDEFANNRRVLLIVDEAQNMDPDSLEELRMLSNVNTEKDQLLQVVLAGQPQLKENLRKPELSQFAQRIAVDYHLHSLSLNETCGYIQHRLVVAGAKRDVFTPEACERIHSYSGGSPRLINLLCETALVYGFADEVELIDADLVEEMVHERMEDSVVPLENLDGEAPRKNTDQLAKDFPWIRPEGGTKGLKPEAKAELSEIEQSKKIAQPEIAQPEISQSQVVEPEVETLSEPVSPLPTERMPEPELPIPNDLISQAELLGSKVTNATAVPENEDVPHEEVVELVGSDSVAIDSVAARTAQRKEAYKKEMFAKNQIKGVKSKKNDILKYIIYAGIGALGLGIAAFYFSGYARDFSVDEENNQALESVSKKTEGVKMPDAAENGAESETEKNENKNKVELEKVEQERLEQEKQVTLAQEKAEKEAEIRQKAAQKREVQEREIQEREMQEQEAQERKAQEQEAQKQLAKERAEKELLEKEQAAQIIEFRKQERREVRKRDADEKRKIARQIKQREAELEAQVQARRRQLEATQIEKAKRAQIEAKNKIKQEQEAQRLEKEWREEQREQLRVEEAVAEKRKVEEVQRKSDKGFVSKSKKKLPANCVGPAAKFKSHCR